jgi:hypothetical protein
VRSSSRERLGWKEGGREGGGEEERSMTKCVRKKKMKRVQSIIIKMVCEFI